MTPTVIFNIGLVLLALLQLGDVWSTNQALSRGAREDNKAMAKAMELLGDKWWIAKLGLMVIAIGILYLVGPQLPAFVVLVGLLGAYGWVVQHNLKQGKK